MVRPVVSSIAALGFTLVYALIFIVMSIVFFFLNVWIIKIGAGWAGYTNLSGDWVVLTAGLLSAASILSSALRKD